MKLNHLTSAAASFTHERHALAYPEGDAIVRRVEAADEVASDRQRSLQQELAEVAPNTLGAFRGEAAIRRSTQDLAERILALGPAASELLKPADPRHLAAVVDEAV